MQADMFELNNLKLYVNNFPVQVSGDEIINIDDIISLLDTPAIDAWFDTINKAPIHKRLHALCLLEEFIYSIYRRDFDLTEEEKEMDIDTLIEYLKNEKNINNKILGL